MLGRLASLAACQPAETVGSPEKGKRVALRWCAECHLASPTQERDGDLFIGFPELARNRRTRSKHGASVNLSDSLGDVNTDLG